MPLPTCDVSDVVLFLDKTSRKHVSIQGRFPQAILGANGHKNLVLLPMLKDLQKF